MVDKNSCLDKCPFHKPNSKRKGTFLITEIHPITDNKAKSFAYYYLSLLILFRSLHWI